MAYTPPEGWNPNQYLANYEDLQNAAKGGGFDPLQHWFEFGQKEGRNYGFIPENPQYTTPPNWDAEQYLINNPDVQKAGVDPLQHWFEFGQKEGRNYAGRVYNPTGDEALINNLMGGIPEGVALPGQYGYIPGLGQVTPEMVTALQTYPQYQQNFNPNEWDLSQHDFLGNAPKGYAGVNMDSSNPFAVPAFLNKQTGEWISVTNMYRLYPHQAADINSMYSSKLGDSGTWLKYIMKPIMQAFPALAAGAAFGPVGAGASLGTFGAIGGASAAAGAAAGAASNTAWNGGELISSQNIGPAISGAVAGYGAGMYGAGNASSYGGLNGTTAESIQGVNPLGGMAGIPETSTSYLGAATSQIPATLSGVGAQPSNMAERAEELSNSYAKTYGEMVSSYQNKTGIEQQTGQIGSTFEAQEARKQALAQQEIQFAEMLAAASEERSAYRAQLEEYIASLKEQFNVSKQNMAENAKNAYQAPSGSVYALSSLINPTQEATGAVEEEENNTFYRPESTQRAQVSELAKRGIKRGVGQTYNRYLKRYV